MARFFILMVLFPAICSAQISEKFSDGDFISSPQWIGTADKFTVDDSYILQLTASAEESEAWLFTESSAIEKAHWSVRVIMNFNPSSNNLARIYLTADAATPSEMTSALFVEIGNTTDNISLYSLSGSNATKLIDGADDRVDLTAVDILIEVIREGNLWTLSSDTGGGLQTDGTVEFSPKYNSSYFGLFCKYTSTRSRKFWFDDIEVTGEPYSDTDPPQLSDYLLVNGEDINLTFSEQIDTTTLPLTNFTLEKLQRNPSSVSVQNGNNTRVINLSFNPALNDVEDEKLIITGVCDLFGNSIKDTSIGFNYTRVYPTGIKAKSDRTVELNFSKNIDETFINEAVTQITPGEFTPQISLSEPRVVTLTLNKPLPEGEEYTLTLSKFKDVTGDTILTSHLLLLYYQPARYDVVFSEIMVDPSPPVGLPESEFVELFNRTNYPINIGGWRLEVNGKSTTIPNFVLMPGKEIALTPVSESNEWDAVQNTLPLTTWLSLTNSSGELVLLNETEKVIDALKYSLDKWGDDSFKQEGGWSFERIDVNNLSGTADSWRYSVSLTGGTPGSANSVKATLPDETAPETVLITYESPDKVKLWFTEPMNLFVKNLISYFEILNGSAVVSEIVADTVFADNCVVVFSDELRRNVVHKFSKISLNDNAGNVMIQNSNCYFGRPDTISQNETEVVINEILFNPRPDGYDFIELFNRSQKIFNLNSLSFAESRESGEITKLFPLVSENILIFPGDYRVFSLSPQNIENEYRCYDKYHLCRMNKFPSMPDDSGIVALSLNNGTVTDWFHYDESMHFPLLNSFEGVSLERISPETETDNAENWHSASEDCGYATPTAVNSQYSDLQKRDNPGFSIEEEIFTPNADGYTDQLIISYLFENPGTVTNITIYNANGVPMKELANNKLLGTEGFIAWDGTTDDGELVSPGIYIILIKTYNSSGKTTTSKMTCVVGTGNSSR